MSRDHSANFKMETNTQQIPAEPVAAMVVGSGPWFSLLLPDGRRYDGLTRRQVKDILPWMPAGTRCDPPLPPGNPSALNLLDSICK